MPNCGGGKEAEERDFRAEDQNIHHHKRGAVLQNWCKWYMNQMRMWRIVKTCTTFAHLNVSYMLHSLGETSISEEGRGSLPHTDSITGLNLLDSSSWSYMIFVAKNSFIWRHSRLSAIYPHFIGKMYISVGFFHTLVDKLYITNIM